LVVILAAFGLAAPVAAQQLIIPATTGTEACTQGGLSEFRPTVLSSLPTPTKSSLNVNVPVLTRRQVNLWEGAVRNTYALRIAVQKNGDGSSPVQEKNLGTVSSGSFLAAQNVTFSDLDNNTRYVVIIYKSGSQGNPYVRRCFKTRGEWAANPVIYPSGGGSISGCFATGQKTRQDVTECFCEGRRGGQQIITGADRTTLGCQDTN